METKFKNLLSGAGKTAKNLIDQAVQAADQNDDGKFDLSDVSAIAGTVGNAVKKGTQVVKESAEDKARQLELKTLQPIFSDSLNSADFLMPKFIRVVERDKKRAESEACQGSIGYASDQKGLHIVNVFQDSVDAFGLMFYPDCDCDFYYVDPSDSDFAKAGLVYTTDGNTNLIGFHTQGNYNTAVSESFAIMGMTLFAEYLDAIAVIDVAEGV